MIEGWKGTGVFAELRRSVVDQVPFAVPSRVDRAAALLDPEVLAAVLASEPAPDTLVVARGRLLDVPAPTTLRALATYMQRGAGLCIRQAERHHDLLRSVAATFEELFPGAKAQVQLFVTPGATYGFSWHYDDEDVFIAQTAGKKDYVFRKNTIAPDRPAHGSVFARLTEETSPLCTAQLHAGDFLYIPARWWHMATSIEDSLSISVGVSGARRTA